MIFHNLAPRRSPGEATSGVLCPVLGFTGQERHGTPGADTAKGYEDD